MNSINVVITEPHICNVFIVYLMKSWYLLPAENVALLRVSTHHIFDYNINLPSFSLPMCVCVCVCMW